MFLREDSVMLLSTDTGNNVEPSALYLGPFIPISLGSSTTKSYPGKCCHVQQRNTQAPLPVSASQWLCTRQPRSPESVLLQRRAGCWRRKPSKRPLFIFSVPQHLPELSSHWNTSHSSAAGRTQGDSPLPASDDYMSFTAENTSVALSGLEEAW